MKSKKPSDSDKEAFLKLRAQAEKSLQSNSWGNTSPEGKDINTLFQELQVHQIELEMLNDELHRANEELEMQRIKFSGIYDLAPVGYFILDKAGVIEEVNSAGIGLLETGRAEIISKRLQTYVAPDHTDNYYRFFRQMIGSNVPQSCQLKFISGAGREFNAQVEGNAIRTISNTQSQCYITVVDITERILAEKALAETKRRLELSLEASGAGTWELDLTSMKFYMDEINFRICGIQEADFDGDYQTFINLVHPDDRNLTDQRLRTAVNQEKEMDFVCRFADRESNPCYISIRGDVIVTPEQGKRIVGIMMDITEKVLMRKESNLLKQNQQKNITAATLSAEENERRRISTALHDSVSQLLYGIKIQLDLLNKPNLKSDTHFAQVYELLNLAVKETRDISFELAPSILTAYGLPATIEELARRLSSSQLQITTKITGFNKRLDPLLENSIYRIVQELINNGMKHSGADLILVELRKNKHIEILVQDNGKGFDVKNQKKKPTGSGLSSIKNRLALYNSATHIDSSPETGTSIKIKLDYKTS